MACRATTSGISSRIRTGGLWAGTDAGVARLEADAGRDDMATKTPRPRVFTAFTTRDGLSDNLIRSLFEDREGNVWVGTNTGGLNRLKLKQVTAFGRPEGLPGDGAVPITEDAEGTLWIGMTCGGLVRYRHDTFTTYGLEDGLPNVCVWSLLGDRDGGLWIGTWGGGLTRRDTDGRFTTYTRSNSGLAARRRARAVSGSLGHVVGRHRQRPGRASRTRRSRVYRRPDGLVHDEVRFITEDRDGALWIGTDRRRQPLQGRDVHELHDGAGPVVELRARDSPDGRRRGVARHLRWRAQPPERRTLHALHTRQGMFENIVSRILEDDQGQFWMTGNKGIVRVRRPSWKISPRARPTRSPAWRTAWVMA